MTETLVRFAPSPTGRLHIGNARPALLNWLFALQRGGRFVLRFDDTDRERSKPEFAAAIEEDLAWLGIAPHQVLHQSDRDGLYSAAAARLKALGRLYPCFETEDELDRRRKRQQARGLPPIYDRAALKLTPEDRARLEAEGRTPHWRFRLDHRVVAWDDLVRGPAHVDAASLSDPVLVRADGTYLYTLPSVVDDAELGITHVIRGEDHVTNTAVQIQLFEVLGSGRVPRFAHHNLLVDASGEGLSKRLGHLSLSALRRDGLEAMAVAALAVLVGSSEAVRPVRDLDTLAEIVDLGKLSRAPARFDERELGALNARLLHATPFSAVADRLVALGITGGEPFWLAIRSNVTRLLEAAQWWSILSLPLAPRIEMEDAGFCAAAADLLPPPPWDEATWSAWTLAVQAASGRKGRALFHPLRLALTGLDQGPDMKALLPLIDPSEVRRRLLRA
jgi:glutamyl-tRNA synthetase